MLPYNEFPFENFRIFDGDDDDDVGTPPVVVDPEELDVDVDEGVIEDCARKCLLVAGNRKSGIPSPSGT